jgi:AraC-like DNA-binding protein
MGRPCFPERVFGFIISNYTEPMDMESLERECGVSRFVISRRFRDIYGVSPIRWLWMYRVLMACRLLLGQRQLSCEDVALACGFQTVSHFNRVFKRILGCSPGDYRIKPVDSHVLTQRLHGSGFIPCG